METCYGCGAQGARFPIVAVMNAEDAVTPQPDKTPSERGFIDVPVCAECHRDPQHRKVPIKGHFFGREQAKVAVEAAGSADIGG
jgi:hypothetical protein